jgi:hypothetical protein
VASPARSLSPLLSPEPKSPTRSVAPTITVGRAQSNDDAAKALKKENKRRAPLRKLEWTEAAITSLFRRKHEYKLNHRKVGKDTIEYRSMEYKIKKPPSRWYEP